MPSSRVRSTWLSRCRVTVDALISSIAAALVRFIQNLPSSPASSGIPHPQTFKPRRGLHEGLALHRFKIPNAPDFWWSE